MTRDGGGTAAGTAAVIQRYERAERDPHMQDADVRHERSERIARRDVSEREEGLVVRARQVARNRVCHAEPVFVAARDPVADLEMGLHLQVGVVVDREVG